MANDTLPTQITVLEQRIAEIPQWAKRNTTKLKWIGGAAACVLVAPIVWTGVVGLVGGVVFVGLGYIATELAPVFARKVSDKKMQMMLAQANQHLAALKAEARKNPIETLQNLYREKQEALEAVKQKIHKFATKVNNYGLNVKKFTEDFPQDAAMFTQTHAEMTALLERRKAKWQEARDNLDKFAKEITRANAIWEMSQATAELREAAGDLEENFFQKVRKETALDAVQQSLAASMADLDQMMMEEIDLRTPTQRPALSNNPSPVIDVVATERPSLVQPCIGTARDVQNFNRNQA